MRQFKEIKVDLNNMILCEITMFLDGYEEVIESGKLDQHQS